MIYHTCVRCGLTDANVLDLDTGGAYHPELRGCISMLRDRLATVEAERDAIREELTQQSITLGAEYQQAERILWALVNPSPTVLHAMASTFDVSKSLHLAIKTASQEVANDHV